MSIVLDFAIKSKLDSFKLDVRAQISDGITGVFGPSGHGKTSLLNAIAGLHKPNSGYINICEQEVYNSDKKINVAIRKRKIGYVFQDFRLFPHYSIYNNIVFGQIKKDTDENISLENVIKVLDIESLLDKKPDQCSGGEKQRVTIARAIVSGARVLLLDEPFSALDTHLRKEIIPFLYAVNREFKIPILIVSHDLPDLLNLTDNLLLLQNGRILSHGKFHDLILDEKNLNILHQSGWYNILHVFVAKSLLEEQLMVLKSTTSNLEVQALIQYSNKALQVNTPLKVLIRPENITLSKQRISNISLRNQIEGTIKKVFLKDGLAFCIVDVGEKIIVEVTEASQKNMRLKVGERVFCLFKSAALKIFSMA